MCRMKINKYIYIKSTVNLVTFRDRVNPPLDIIHAH